MGLNSRYGVSGAGSSATPSKWKQYGFAEATGTITEGDPQALLVAQSLVGTNPSNFFLIHATIQFDSPNTITVPNLIFTLNVDGVTIATGNQSAVAFGVETFCFTFLAQASATDGLVELLWEFTSDTPGASINASSATLMIEEVSQ